MIGKILVSGLETGRIIGKSGGSDGTRTRNIQIDSLAL